MNIINIFLHVSQRNMNAQEWHPTAPRTKWKKIGKCTNRESLASVRCAEQARRNEPAVVACVLSQTRNIPRRERHDSAESYGTIGTCMWWKVVSYYWAVRDQPYRQFRPKLLTYASFENFAGIMEKIGNIRGITYIRRCAINPTLLPRDRFRRAGGWGREEISPLPRYRNFVLCKYFRFSLRQLFKKRSNSIQSKLEDGDRA